MTRGLRRFHESGQSHFITFSCYQRVQNLDTPKARTLFEDALERVRRSYGLRVYGYVVMPEHAHLLISEPQRKTLAVAIKSLKQGVSRQLISQAEHFWQHRYYDFNLRNYPQFTEKLRYIHRNPVTRGLCKLPEQWLWSSYNHYATGFQGRVEIESDWTANKRDRDAGTLCKQIKQSLDWPPAEMLEWLD